MKITHSRFSGFTLILLFLFFSFQLNAQERTRDDLEELKITNSGVGSSLAPSPYNFPENGLAVGSQKVNACATSNNLATPYNTNNGQRGCMFNVTATTTVTVSCFESNLYAGTTADYEIYYRAGTHVGNENNSAAWTFLGGATGVTSAGNNVPTPLPIPISVTIPAGQTYAFYITNTFGGGTSYTDGTAVGNFLAGDANITVYQGVGKSYPFGLTFSVRNFNGHIFYTPGGVLNARNTVLKGKGIQEGIQLSWTPGTDTETSAFVLERSLDGVNYEQVQSVGSGSESFEILDESTQPETAYFYRLRMETPDGNTVYSNTVEATRPRPQQVQASVFPNPTTGNATLTLEPDFASQANIRLLDAVGKQVYATSVELTGGTQEINLPLDNLAPGLYFTEVNAGGKREILRVLKN